MCFLAQYWCVTHTPLPIKQTPPPALYPILRPALQPLRAGATALPAASHWETQLTSSEAFRPEQECLHALVGENT